MKLLYELVVIRESLAADLLTIGVHTRSKSGIRLKLAGISDVLVNCDILVGSCTICCNTVLKLLDL